MSIFPKPLDLSCRASTSDRLKTTPLACLAVISRAFYDCMSHLGHQRGAWQTITARAVHPLYIAFHPKYMTNRLQTQSLPLDEQRCRPVARPAEIAKSAFNRGILGSSNIGLKTNANSRLPACTAWLSARHQNTLDDNCQPPMTRL